MKRIALIGCGGWGKNHARTWHSLGALKWVCDSNPDSLAAVKKSFPEVFTTQNLDDVLSDKEVAGIIIATPPATHCAIAVRAMEMGKHIFVEKPMALTLSDAKKMNEVAKRSDRKLMVGHVLEYHPAIRKLQALVDSGALGRIYTICSSRLNLGKVRTEENSLWSFAPHDIAIIQRIAGEEPEVVSCNGGAYLNPEIADCTVTTLKFPSGMMASISVSWLHPYKDHSFVVVGSDQMAVFNDLLPWKEKLKLYPHKVNWVQGKIPVTEKAEAMAVSIEEKEPLLAECEHFLECISANKKPFTDGEEGVRVLASLEAAETSLRNGGVPKKLTPIESDTAFVHPSSVVDDGAKLGEGTKIWHYSHISGSVVVGKKCNFGQNVFVANHVKIGDGVKVQNNVSIYEGVELEDYVFCGPSMVFTNVMNPRSQFERKNEYKKTVVKKGATIGANATIVCGNTIGRHAFIGAGAVVTKDVPDYALVMGNPARRTAWMCECGVGKLEFNKKRATCAHCSRNYRQESAEKIMEEVHGVESSAGLRLVPAA
jgi:UDP-2-acetamido-3-amino-2,3-dideoxy-glucuronate N-acetyltransferase